VGFGDSIVGSTNWKKGYGFKANILYWNGFIYRRLLEPGSAVYVSVASEVRAYVYELNSNNQTITKFLFTKAEQEMSSGARSSWQL